MANVLGQWRNYARMLVLLVLVVCTMAFLRHPDFARRAGPVKQETVQITQPGEKPSLAYADKVDQVGSQKWFEDKANVPQMQRQQITSVALRHLLPVGLTGLFLLVMVLGLFAGDGNHIHSWSSIFIQDLLVPLRRGKPLSPAAHLKFLRLSVVGVAAFAFLFSWLVR